MPPDLDFIRHALNPAVENHSGGNVAFTGISIDSRTLVPGQLFAALSGPSFDGHAFIPKAVAAGARAVLVERKWQETTPVPVVRVDGVLDALTRLALAWRRHVAATVIAVTGSSGKTTVKEMLALCLGQHMHGVHATRGNLNNHIGVPLTLLSLPADCRVAVVEMGMSAAGEITHLAGIAQPDIGLVTNVFPAHIAAFGSLLDIAHAKGELLAALPPEGVAILPSGRWESAMLATLSRPQRRLTFGIDENATISAREIVTTLEDTTFDLQIAGEPPVQARIHGRGNHLIDNALAAAAAAHAIKVPVTAIVRGLEEFRLQKGRGEVKNTPGGWQVIDDTYNANPGSMAAALARLGSDTHRRRIAVLGDMLELGDSAVKLHEALATAVIDAGISRLFTTGELMRHLARRLENHPNLQVDHRHDAGEWIGVLPGLCRPGDLVLVKGSRGMKMERIVEDLGRHAV
ncbi:MAG: UDP-N-acetylmuramoyl-tripeptide--D-alanyl-D-alanine ligase [Magnetococcales bacterium]|nr:UDP-N-acetylmuramoyl-tripeptide--D-alanyl-D-alanine ligase [Magnetococcales bacterium]